MDSSNPYAAPQSAIIPAELSESQAHAWRQGDVLIVTARAELPPRCVKCNVPTDELMIRKFNLVWYPSIAYLGLLLGALPFILLAIILQKKMSVFAAVCADHRRKRRYAMLFAWLGVLAALVMIIGGASSGKAAGAVIAVGGVLVFLSAVLYGIIGSRLIWPKRINKQFAWIKGACPEYLATFPEFP